MNDFKIEAIGAKKSTSVQDTINKYKKYMLASGQNRNLPATWFSDHLKEANAGFNAPGNANPLGTTNK